MKKLSQILSFVKFVVNKATTECLEKDAKHHSITCTTMVKAGAHIQHKASINHALVLYIVL